MKFIEFLLKFSGTSLGQRVIANLAEKAGVPEEWIALLIDWLKTLAPAQLLAVGQMLLPEFSAACPADCDCDLPDCPHEVQQAIAAIAASGVAAELEAA